jgi:hypothetical protein
MHRYESGFALLRGQAALHQPADLTKDNPVMVGSGSSRLVSRTQRMSPISLEWRMSPDASSARAEEARDGSGVAGRHVTARDQIGAVESASTPSSPSVAETA